ncbi:hypothetical protein [Dendrosporobacter sp. 1207_IL3150]|uniref:hypothetical protein n=1 Tax=Dendrosporobacter sp. 1207_IL3150 TaxID=3084054 RepID=UPI002FD9AFA6
MTYKEYQEWIDYINRYHFPLADSVVQDMNNWRNISILARALVRAKKYAPAIELFKSIIEVNINHEEKDCFNLSEVEDKVWCLQELAISLWHTTGKRGEALKYVEEALTIIAKYPRQFNFLDRCEVWREIQDFIFFTSKGKSRKGIAG